MSSFRARCVHLLAPEGFDDPGWPSGGNTYDRKVVEALRAAGRYVEVHRVPWPTPGTDATPEATAALLPALPDRATLLVDGLLAAPAAEVLVRESTRLRLVVLVHLPSPAGTSGFEREAEVLRAAASVVATSTWTRDVLAERHGIAPERVHVAVPGVDRGVPADSTPGGGRLLCVANVVPAKGQDVLVEALAQVWELPWRCTFVGSPDVAPDHARRVQELAGRRELDGRVEWVGALAPAALEERYAASDLLVHPSLGETYGMVVAEALAHGVPVLVSDVGGVSEALGMTPAGVPGALVPASDPGALADALRRWFGDPAWSVRLVRAARERRSSLPRWATTAERVGRVLEQAVV